MREKLKTLPLKELRAIAKDLNIPAYYTLNKTDLIEKLVEIDEQKKKEAAEPAPAERPAKKPQHRRVVKKNAPEPAKEEEKAAKKELPESVNEPQVQTTAETVLDEPEENTPPKSIQELDSGKKASGILEILPEQGYGFLRSNGFMSGDDDLYVANSQIKRFGLKTGDYIVGSVRNRRGEEKYCALLYIDSINGMSVAQHEHVTPFENLTPVFPNERLRLERPYGDISMRIVDLLCPIGKGQRGMIVAQPKVGKTTLLKQIAKSLLTNHPELHIMILLIDERPEEVTDMQDTFQHAENLEIIYSTFDELPEHHKRMSEIVIERAKRLVEYKKDVVILLDSITRLTRAYNLTCTPSGRTLSGGLDPSALYMPKRFFGAARCMKEGGSLTILATALQETGSRLDDVVYEEFKGTGNMELVLNRKLSEKRIFPAIDIQKSSTRRDDLLLTPVEQDAASFVHRVTTQGSRPEAATEQVLDLFASTRTNAEFMAKIKNNSSFYGY